METALCLGGFCYFFHKSAQIFQNSLTTFHICDNFVCTYMI
jgi:hypothetical protein